MQRIVKLKREIGSHTVGVGGDEYAAAVSFYTRPPTYRCMPPAEHRLFIVTHTLSRATHSDSITLEEFELFAFDRLRGNSLSLSLSKGKENQIGCLRLFSPDFFCAQKFLFGFQKF
jgi:hypothetical protein